MSHDNFIGLALLSIKTVMIEKLDYVCLMNDFADKSLNKTIF